MNGNPEKLTDLRDAVARYVQPGSVLGIGGQNINRCPMAIVHEIVRQGVDGLTVVGCNLSLPLDLLVAAGAVERTEQGSGNLERFGSLHAWRRAVEGGQVTSVDHSHLAMASRFLGGTLGVPHMITRSLLGSDILDRLVAAGGAQVGRDPWTAEPVVLLPSLRPDVSIIHVSRADETGNVVIDGVSSHEIDMVRASRAAIVTAEEIVPRSVLSRSPETVTISGAYVTAVVHQPFGAFPTSMYNRYDFFEDEVRQYQAAAREGGSRLRDYLADWVFGVDSFGEYLHKRDPAGLERRSLEDAMRSLP